jgi:hypothetical protein
MTIVANTYMLNLFRQIDLFKLNLGKSLTPINEDRIVIKDPFMLKYLNMTGKQILTYGSIGKLIFYQDYTLPQKEFYIFNDESIYGLVYTDNDTKNTPQSYLASIIQEINEKEGIKESSDTIKDKKKGPDMKLPTEQYIEEMLKKRKLGYA